MRVRKLSLPPKLLILLASTALSIGLIESVFRALQSSDPELSVDVIAADQQVPRDRKRISHAIGNMVDDAFLDLRIAPRLFGREHVRVLFLGDSFTQGAGIEKPQHRSATCSKVAST